MVMGHKGNNLLLTLLLVFSAIPFSNGKIVDCNWLHYTDYLDANGESTKGRFPSRILKTELELSPPTSDYPFKKTNTVNLVEEYLVLLISNNAEGADDIFTLKLQGIVSINTLLNMLDYFCH
jgi:hypothetical protein